MNTCLNYYYTKVVGISYLILHAAVGRHDVRRGCWGSGCGALRHGLRPARAAHGGAPPRARHPGHRLWLLLLCHWHLRHVAYLQWDPAVAVAGSGMVYVVRE